MILFEKISSMFDISAPASSALRHLYTATAAATAALTIAGMSQGDTTTIGVAVHQIGDGIASVIAGVTALTPIVMAAYSAWSGTRKARLIDMDKDPEIKKMEMVPNTAAAQEAATIPGNKVS